MDSKKLIALLLLLVCLHWRVPVYGQQPSFLLTLSEKNAPLEKILDSIEKKTGYTHFGDAAWPQLSRKVTISVKNATIRQVLDICFKDQPLAYELVGTTINIRVKEVKGITIHGRIINEKGEPVPNATIRVKSNGQQTFSKDSGEFSIRVPDPDASLVISNINYERQEVRLIEGKDTIVQLKERVSTLIDAVVYTGYQQVPGERATGSFTKINNALINRRVSPNILDRLDGVTSSMLFNKNQVNGTNQSVISIRGRSTIFANPEPLIIVDNFPYSGNINTINPDDVESITVLKDAAAASIWGAFSGNGVIVITTKKGKYNQAPTLSFNTSIVFGNKPDLYYQPILSSGDYIDVEQYLFKKSFYNGWEMNPQHPALSPLVEILIKERDSLISPTEAATRINTLRRQDRRQDLGKYFYRSSLNRQYFLNLSGGGPNDQYYFSAGYDKDLASLVRNEYERVTLNGNNTYILWPKKLELSTGFAFTSSTTHNNNSGNPGVTYPYAKLADAKGNALSVPYLLRQSYIDTAGGGQLPDWNYRPLDELRYADNTTRLTHYRVNIGIRYIILKGLDAHALYQYERNLSNQQILQSQQTYFTRNLVNEYTQLNAGGLTRPVPLGGILDEMDSSFRTHNFRFQLDYDHHFTPEQGLVAIAGVELRDMEGDPLRASRLYGYNKNLQSSQPVDYTPFYPQYSSPGLSLQVPYINHNSVSSDRYLSYYFNGSYHYLQRYILSASVRKDESNLFGVNTNQKGVPLWSAGAAWEISREAFYRVDWLPYLKLRITNGYNGNVDKSLSAYTTVVINPINNPYGAVYATINNPPNPSLRWEKIHILNTGVDFASRGGRVAGSLEYYIKTGEDLIGLSPLDPTTGNTEFRGNTAGMKSQGIDLVLYTKNITGPVCWSSAFLFSYTRDKVTSYKNKLSTIGSYLNTAFINPLEGRPLYSVYALRWMGLDPQTGDPQGWLNGHTSKDYVTLNNSSDFGNLKFVGPATPSFFGSLCNSLYWKQFGLSFNILYKFGYYFRRRSIHYNDLFNGVSRGHPDFDKRWQKPGDEKITYVPSMIYPADPARDAFYTYSEVLVEKGDHIRLQDIQLSYDLQKQSFPKLPVQAIRIYLYADNIGILWKANHQGIDPDYVNVTSIPNPRTLAVGVKLNF